MISVEFSLDPQSLSHFFLQNTFYACQNCRMVIGNQYPQDEIFHDSKISKKNIPILGSGALGFNWINLIFPLQNLRFV